MRLSASTAIILGPLPVHSPDCDTENHDPKSGDVPRRGGERLVNPTDDSVGGFTTTMLDFLTQIPHSEEISSETPLARASAIARAAAVKAALVSGTLSLPPGPAGWLTIVPDLMGVWKIQTQMVADIAAAFGQQAFLTREQMLYCLFRHAAAQAVRDLVIRVGERALILGTAERVAASCSQGRRSSQPTRDWKRRLAVAAGDWRARCRGVRGYTDTGQVAHTTIELFARPIDVEPEIAEIEA